MGRYRDPLLWSVHDLRSHIRAILDEDFLGRYLITADDTILGDGDAFMRPYARRHTMFVLAQYLGWVEILRWDIGFLDLGDRRRNRRLVELLSVIRRVLFATDLGEVFHVPPGHQRGCWRAYDRPRPRYARARALYRIRQILRTVDERRKFRRLVRSDRGRDRQVCQQP
jgi:hypothetical protein